MMDGVQFAPLGGLANSNYAITYTGANLTVTAAPLAVTADAQSRLYGAANPALTYVSSGLLNGDTLSGGLATSATITSNMWITTSDIPVSENSIAMGIAAALSLLIGCGLMALLFYSSRHE